MSISSNRQSGANTGVARPKHACGKERQCGHPSGRVAQFHLGKSIAGVLSNFRSPREVEFATDTLRVIGSSVFPITTSGNLDAPAVRIGEKVADRVFGRDPFCPRTPIIGRIQTGEPGSGETRYAGSPVAAQTVIALGARMQASRHRAHPTQMSWLICGRTPSRHSRAPGTGQLSAQAPHSGPE